MIGIFLNFMLKYLITNDNEGKTPIYTTTVIKQKFICGAVTLMFIRKKLIMGIELT